MPTISIPKNPAHRREWIKYQLRLRGSNFSVIARTMGVCREAPRLALRRPYPRMERAIANALGLKPEQIWPERYDAKGKPNRPMGRPKKSIDKHTTRGSRRNVKKQEAA